MAKGTSKAEPYPIGRLFAIATVEFEDAATIAVAGQNRRLTRVQQKVTLRRLKRALGRSTTAVGALTTALENHRS